MLCYCMKHLCLVEIAQNDNSICLSLHCIFSLRYRGEVSLAYFRSDS
jgi:hypothetical protein